MLETLQQPLLSIIKNWNKHFVSMYSISFLNFFLPASPILKLSKCKKYIEVVTRTTIVTRTTMVTKTTMVKKAMILNRTTHKAVSKKVATKVSQLNSEPPNEFTFLVSTDVLILCCNYLMSSYLFLKPFR